MGFLIIGTSHEQIVKHMNQFNLKHKMWKQKLLPSIIVLLLQR